MHNIICHQGNANGNHMRYHIIFTRVVIIKEEKNKY